ncbi:MAG: hypothetical protein ACRDPO_15815 [Streptosporangiaceae bacterium]
MNSIDQAGAVQASLAAPEPTDEERAAAAAMLRLIVGLDLAAVHHLPRPLLPAHRRSL